ncbi:unnamed protein product [Cylicostephanus goldi]|uniref:PB1 domain-containing protein n=1 Tax=Cylicostephanus goldi TaxID=71465 RepID=A0A3P6QXL7_CYLGO|nr:unnamed protein product [Cylicostephanus goldi]
MAEEKRTATFKIFFEVPRFTINYKNKKDLFKAFQKKLEELNLNSDGIMWADWDGDRFVIKSPDDLLGAVDLYSGSPVKIFYPTPRHQETTISSSDEEEKKEEEKNEEEKCEEVEVKGCRSRSPSCDRRRHRSRSFSCDERGPYGYSKIPINPHADSGFSYGYSVPPPYYLFNPALGMDPRCPYMQPYIHKDNFLPPFAEQSCKFMPSFLSEIPCKTKNSKRQRRRQCSCERLCKDLSKM